MITFSDIRRFWHFYKDADTKYTLHSPFVFDFITNILDTSKDYYCYADIENIRARLLGINKEIDYTDYGAGSKISNTAKRKIKEIAKTSATQPNAGRILYNIVVHYKPKMMMELGTSFGIGSMYLASAISETRLLTIEGNKGSSYIAQRNFELLGLKNIELIEGDFDNVLPELLEKIYKLDLVYLDGNHKEEATIKYFNLLIEKADENSIFILDDIYWSDGMLRAWNKIKKHRAVTLTINIFSKGFLFFDSSFNEKQHHKIISTKYKPWKIGLTV